NWLSHTRQSVLGSNWGAGDIMYKDLDGDGEVNAGSNTLNDHGDLRVIGNNNPRYRFGINLGATYKGWDFSAFLQGVLKRDLWLDGPMFWGMVGNVWQAADRKSTRLNSSHVKISYAVFCLKKKKIDKYRSNTT